MGDGAYEFSVLYDGAAAHALNDSAGDIEQFFVLYFDYKTLL